MPALKCKHCGGINSIKAGVPDYMLTFGDLNSLLLTFFVLLIASAVFDVKKFNIIVSAFSGSFGQFDGGKMVVPADLPDLGVKPTELDEQVPDDKVVSMAKVESATLSPEQLSASKNGEIEIKETEEGLVIQVTDQLLFEGGSADIRNPEAKSVLTKIGHFLGNIPGLRDRDIRIEGHTDDIRQEVPYMGKIYSNWELSVLRASSVLRQLNTGGGVEEKRMSVAGFGEYKPLERKPEESEDAWRKRNRRVDIVVLRNKSKK